MFVYLACWELGCRAEVIYPSICPTPFQRGNSGAHTERKERLREWVPVPLRGCGGKRVAALLGSLLRGQVKKKKVCGCVE